jgi:Zn-dependent oligopeptidase
MKRPCRITRRNYRSRCSEAKEKGKEGWIFTLDHPSVPFMTYADNRELRKN